MTTPNNKTETQMRNNIVRTHNSLMDKAISQFDSRTYTLLFVRMVHQMNDQMAGHLADQTNINMNVNLK